MKVTRRLWRTVSRLANSIIGMRCPIPGVGNIATRGGSSSCFGVVCAKVRCYLEFGHIVLAVDTSMLVNEN
ncbi:hypothetical protein TSUD_360440 [Trifolium subterraneum]|uniref:Uncharacterized protein n=1 Tax=Trifolium subterraneum TaxID=3900 RepID=A0A2Z6NDZ5_TRISU|nr:hypothetical protein TSUD_360440 [Trifolium subterraneum]